MGSFIYFKLEKCSLVAWYENPLDRRIYGNLKAAEVQNSCSKKGITWHCCGEVFPKPIFRYVFFEKILVTYIIPRNINLIYLMKIKFNNLYTHFVFITHLRQMSNSRENWTKRNTIKEWIFSRNMTISSRSRVLRRDQANYKIDKIWFWRSLSGY